MPSAGGMSGQLSLPLVHRAAPREPGAARSGAFVEHPQLTQLSAMLKAVDAGDRIIKGRLELFSCFNRVLAQKDKRELERRTPECFTASPLGPMSTESSQRLLGNLRAFMSLLFVNYDCSTVTPADFERGVDKHAVVATINNSLAMVVERIHSGFLAEFWQAVQDAIDVANCDIFAFRPPGGSFGPMDNSLMSHYYFFVDAAGGTILFIGSVMKSRAALHGGCNDSDSDVLLSNRSASGESSRRGADSDMGSSGRSLQEGEVVAFSDGSDDDMAD